MVKTLSITLQVKECIACPYCHSNKDAGVHYCQYQAHNWLVLPFDQEDIPEWCPLPDDTLPEAKVPR